MCLKFMSLSSNGQFVAQFLFQKGHFLYVYMANGNVETDWEGHFIKIHSAIPQG